MAIVPGARISHYRLLDKLGEGGMGVVYRAWDERLERHVAIKVIGERLLADEAARGRFLREARTASALNHPHICVIHEVGEADDRAYIVMEHVEGKPLAALIPPHGLPAGTLLRYAIQVADALAHAHGRGVVHRDLKSANVVVTPEGRAKVLDFGLAKRAAAGDADLEATRSATPLTGLGTVVGTMHYLPPEVLSGGRPTRAAISGRWAFFSTRWRPAGCPSKGGPRSRSPPPSSGSRRSLSRPACRAACAR